MEQPETPCACGCGERTSPHRDGGYRTWIHGHNSREQSRGICSVEACGAAVHAHGLCSKHASRLARWGTTDARPRLRGRELFWSKVNKTEGCWIWTGYRQPEGYGRVDAKTKLTSSGTRLAHRIAYELLVGPIPDGLHLDHLCRIPACVNPDHLEPVTSAENTRRGLHGELRTECKRGHELTPENTRIRASDNSRKCRQCDREDAAAKRAAMPKKVHKFHVKERTACGTDAGTAAGIALHRASNQPVCAACDVERKRLNNAAYRARKKAA